VSVETPEGWAVATISDITEYLSRGKQPKYVSHSSLPVINQRAIRWFGLQNEYLKYVDPAQFDQWEPERFIRSGDILWNSTGTGTLGRACLVTHRDLDSPKVVDSHVTIVRPYQAAIDPRFLFAWIQSSEVQENIASLATGATNQIELSRATIASIRIPIAPLNEQKRIADKLDALLARVNACRDRLDRVSLILDRFRQSVLAAAISGEITEDWREEGFDIDPGTNLLKKTSFTLVTSEDDLPLLPNNWTWVALGDYAQCSRGRFSARPRNDPTYFKGSHPFIQIGDLPSGGGLITAHRQTLNDKGLEVSKKFPKGTVVIAIVGATIGNTGILGYDMCLTDSMIALETGDEVSNQYVELFLRHRKEHIRQTSYAGGGQPNIKLEVLKPYPLALPPLQEQYEIVRRVESLFAYADRLEERYWNAYNQVEQLIPALLDKAFRGELVPQDPSNEPATVLLNRIRAGRAAQPIKPKRVLTDRKPTMTKMTKEFVKEVIHQLPKDRFSFDELRENLPDDYDALRDILFTLLSEVEPSIMQVFDQEAKVMHFVKGRR
jgi:type I restriction enzyme, S subunit